MAEFLVEGRFKIRIYKRKTGQSFAHRKAMPSSEHIAISAHGAEARRCRSPDGSGHHPLVLSDQS